MKRLYWYRQWHWDNDIHAPHGTTSAAIYSIGGLTGNWSLEAGSVDTDSDSCAVKWFFFFFFFSWQGCYHTHTHSQKQVSFDPDLLLPACSMHVWLRGMFVLWMRCDAFSLDQRFYYQIQIVVWLVCLGSHCSGHQVSLTAHHRPFFIFYSGADSQ